MKVFLDPAIGLHSRAMTRIANALTRYAPPEVEIVSDIDQSELAIFYPIGIDWSEHFARCLEVGRKYAIVQCCLRTSGGTIADWLPWWSTAECVWSYYDLRMAAAVNRRIRRPGSATKFNIYHAPLGIDPVFLDTAEHLERDHIITTGYVHGRPAESILEPWIAARETGLKIVHIGGWPTGIQESEWREHVRLLNGISDEQLAIEYSRAKFVCSLRYVEGFELPAAEGLACGACAILFDQPDLKQWYRSHAIYVPEVEGEELVGKLKTIFESNVPVDDQERREVCRIFDWSVIAAGFWKRLTNGGKK